MAGPGHLTATLPADAIEPEPGLSYSYVRLTVYADNRTDGVVVVRLCDAVDMDVPSKATGARLDANGLAFRNLDGNWDLSLYASGEVFLDVWLK